MSTSRLILAYDTLKDPRDLAEVLHLATGFAAEVHLLGRSLTPDHWKVLRKLRSWRPELAEHPERMAEASYPDAASWVQAMRAQGMEIVATVLDGGERPWSNPLRGAPAILFGEETHGLAADVLRRADHLWTIPLGGGGRFYTVGQATAILLGGMLVREQAGGPGAERSPGAARKTPSDNEAKRPWNQTFMESDD